MTDGLEINPSVVVSNKSGDYGSSALSIPAGYLAVI